MIRFPLFILFAFLIVFNTPSYVRAQVSKFDENELKAELELLKNDSLMSELKSLLGSMYKPESFFSANLGYSNRLFSTKNNALNAQQTKTGQAALLPSVSYFHQSGLGLTATGFMRTVDGKPSFYQLAVSPSYDYIGKKVIAGVSYTNYIKTVSNALLATPFTHEVYAYAQLKKSIVRPFVALGWASGTYQDVSQIPLRIRGENIFVLDTSKVFLNDFSTTVGLSHTFTVQKIFTKDDMITFVPSLNLIAELQNYRTVPQSIGVLKDLDEDPDDDDQIDIDRIRQRFNLNPKTLSKFSFQTLAFSANANWYNSSYSVSAGYFLGYYFNNVNTTKFAHFFNLSVGVTF
ncbi:MAG: hypothetical protein RLZZ204_1385 [Bacteroidota bacterium]|jgi:hypothetical protein